MTDIQLNPHPTQPGTLIAQRDRTHLAALFPVKLADPGGPWFVRRPGCRAVRHPSKAAALAAVCGSEAVDHA